MEETTRKDGAPGRQSRVKLPKFSAGFAGSRLEGEGRTRMGSVKKAVLVLVKPKEKGEDNRVVDPHPHVNGEAEGKARRRRWMPRVGFSPGGSPPEPPITQPKVGKMRLPNMERSPGDPEFNRVMTEVTPRFNLGGFRGEGTPKFQLPKVALTPQALESPKPLTRSRPTMGTLVVGAEYYDLVATVGKGTFGEVTQGWRRSTGEMVAIKILKNEGHHGRVVKNELRLLQALREVNTEESHVVRFLESFGDGACTYLVFELLEQNLFEFQKRNNFLPLPVRHIRTITAQVLAALVKLKELSIIHADLKPENIMLVDHARYPFRVKLIDFGSASIVTEVCHVKEPYIQSRFYRAPEILLGLPFCEKVDIWSLGCVVAELHLGWPLYPGINEYDQVRYICSTLGLPRGELLCAARKTRSFFQRLAVVNIRPHCDLCGMVELVKRMLTWDSHERIMPSAALKHPFISLQQQHHHLCRTHRYTPPSPSPCTCCGSPGRRGSGLAPHSPAP
uniref:Protein kinase domain-containing protein n=1 Tax=Buteo japonicus TaxID=224669 RepID=A0A8B9Z840_9AVES